MDGLLAWVQTNLWQTGFVFLLLIFVCVPFVLVRRRIQAILGQFEHWRELEQNIQDVGKEEVRLYPHPTRYVLQAVLSSTKGTARAGAVPAALDYLAAEVESPILTLRSLSYLAVLVGLLGTVTMLAMALHHMDSLSQFKADLLKNIYPINAFAIGLAVAIFLSYSWYRHQGDQFLLLASRVLGRLRAEQTGGADPHLLAALEKVGESFREWGEEIHEHYHNKLRDLLQEVRELGLAIREVVSEAVLSRKEEDQSIMPLLHSQDAKLGRLEQGYLDLNQKIGVGIDAGLPELDRIGRDSRGPKKPGFFRRHFGQGG
ncbi:MAG: MotA/TolQ/ExbB proton channel family protein [Deltaproteobacteria bacterium]|nr:MotA/TolQ/ExbB proton channel family protein [Deltaproteobacteria bacterium]